MIWFTAGAALAAELRVVRSGDTVESIATSLGDPTLASSIRGLNALAPTEQAPVGRLLVLPAPSVPQVDQEGFLVSIVGEASVTEAGTPTVAAELFESVPAGSVVCTGAKSFATLRLASACEGHGLVNDHVTLMSDTCVELRATVASSLRRASALRVRSGSIVVAEADGRAQVPPGSVTVEAGDGVVTGAGGFRVHRVSDGALRAEALFADLAVLGAGRETVLRPGEGVSVPPASGPLLSVDLLGARPLVEPEPGAPLTRPTFRWEPDALAFGYLLTIAGDAEFTRVLYQEPVPDPVCAPALLLLPLRGLEGLFWRVEAVDRLGYIGMPTAARPLSLPPGVLP